MKFYTISLIILLLLLCGCSSREHNNPFDPLNPETKGAPTGLEISSNRDTIIFRWSPVEVDDLEEYRVYFSNGNNPLQYLQNVRATENQLQLIRCFYDIRYNFAVKAITKYDEGPLSDSVSIIPGPYNLLLTDYYDYTLKRLSYDGNYVYRITEITSPIALAADCGHGIIFVASYWQHSVFYLNRAFKITRSVELSNHPVDMSYDARSNRLFLLEKGENRLSVYSREGNLQEMVALPLECNLQTKIALDVISNTVWIASQNDATVIAVDFSNPERSVKNIAEIAVSGKVDVSPVTDGCWVATDSGVVRITASGNFSVFKTEYHITDISVNPDNGDCYYVGYRRSDNRWVAGRLRFGMQIIDEVLLEQDYRWLYAIQVIPGANDAGFFVMQANTWRLLRFDANGHKIGELPEYSAQLDFFLE